MNDVASETIESPKENGKYLIEVDLTFSGVECWSVFFKKNDCDEWEAQRSFAMRADALAWVNSEIEKA